MALLTPLFLFGLLGIALPLWLHRLQTQKNERELFSSAMFLEQSRHQIHVQRKLKYLLLLALRILFLVLLVLAFTRPVWQTTVDSFLAAEDTQHVIVLDSSFSMRQGDHFEQAQARARAIVAGLSSGDQASLYSASSQLDRVVEMSADPAVLEQGINGLSPDMGRLDLGQMMAALGSSLQTHANPIKLHVISDFQRSSQPLRFADLVPRDISKHNITLEPVRIGSSNTGNWAISAISANVNAVEVHVQGFNTQAAEHSVELLLNGNSQGQQSQEIPANGQALFRFEALALVSGDNRVEARLVANDSLPADDQRLSIIDNSPPAPVLVLTHNPNSLALTYIRAALATAPRPYVAEVVTLNDLDSRILQRYPWIIIEDLSMLNSSLAEAVQAYIAGGGAVFAALSGERQPDIIPVGGQSLRSGFIRGGDERYTITRLDNSHPTLQASSSWANVKVSRALPLTPHAEDRVLIGLSREIPFLLQRDIGLGTLMMLNGGLDNTTTDLPLRPVFVGFLAETARYLSGEDFLQRERIIDSTLQLQASGGSSGQVYDPTGERLLSLSDTTQNRSVELRQSGFYQVFTPEGERLIAVNPDPRESDITAMEVQTLQSWQNSVAAAARSNTSRAVDSGASDSSLDSNVATIEIWRVILILLVMIVLAESLLGNRHLRVNTGSPT